MAGREIGGGRPEIHLPTLWGGRPRSRSERGRVGQGARVKAAGELRIQWGESPWLAFADQVVDRGYDGLAVWFREVVAVRSVGGPVGRGGKRARRRVEVPPAVLHLEDLLEHERRSRPRDVLIETDQRVGLLDRPHDGVVDVKGIQRLDIDHLARNSKFL